MRMILLCLCVAGVSIGGSFSVHHFPFNLLLTIPCSFGIGYFIVKGVK